MFLCVVKEARGLFNRVIAMSPLLEYDKEQFEYAPRLDGELVLKDAFINFEKYVDPNIEFMFGLPTEELGHVGGILGKKISTEMRQYYWDTYIKSLRNAQIVQLEKIQENKYKVFDSTDKALYFIEFLIYHYL